MKVTIKYDFGQLLSLLIYLATSILLVAIAAFSFFYIFNSFRYLSSWYLGLNPCIYKEATWSQFFNPATKQRGNLFCIVAIILSISGLVYIISRKLGRPRFKRGKPITLVIAWQDLWISGLLFVLLVLLWFWGQTFVSPALDEVFSAVNCASVPVFQCLSYYMLPNNHIFFNVLNNLFFHNAGDKVFTGRLISLAAYLVLVIWSYFWFAKQFKNRFRGFMASLALAVQLPVWGFAFQARGYEIYALAQWAAFVLLFDNLETGDKKYLVLNSVCCIAGYFTIPTFLYFHAAQLLFMALYQVVHKRFDIKFWKYQAITAVFVFFFYLPALGFSGIGAMLHNKYVVPIDMGTVAFFHTVMYFSRSYIQYCFTDGVKTIGYILFCLPVLLLFLKKRWLGIFYLVLIITFLALVFEMKRYPFHRNLIGQFSIVLSLCIVAIQDILERLWHKSIKLLFPILMLLLTIYLFRFSTKAMPNELYFSDTTPTFTAIKHSLGSLPKGAVMGCSDESFYWYYLCRQQHIAASQCPDGSENYFVKQRDELFPSNLDSSEYILLHKVLDYEVFEKK